MARRTGGISPLLLYLQGTDRCLVRPDHRCADLDPGRRAVVSRFTAPTGEGVDGRHPGRDCARSAAARHLQSRQRHHRYLHSEPRRRVRHPRGDAPVYRTSARREPLRSSRDRVATAPIRRRLVWRANHPVLVSIRVQRGSRDPGGAREQPQTSAVHGLLLRHRVPCDHRGIP